MKCEWKTYQIGDICSSISETYKGKDEYVVLINTSDVLDGKILNHSLTKNANLKGQFKKKIQAKDILYSEIRPANKRFAFVDIEDTHNYIASTKLMVIRANSEIVLPEYLFIFLQMPAVIAELQILAETRSGTFPQITFSSEISPLCINIPDKEIQKRIVHIFRSLDYKIELNDKINENMRGQMQAIYQEWFGDVDAAKEQGVLSDICTYSKEKVAVSKLDVSTYFSTENMLPGKAGAVEASNLPTTAQTTACHIGDTLISNIRPYFKKIVYCHEKCGCSTDVLCFEPVHPKYSAYLYSTLYADRFFDFMVAGSMGTKMPRGDKQQIMTYPMVLPLDADLEAFNSVAIPILNQLQNNHNENKFLIFLRDTLLPKLMNGEITVDGI